MKKITDNIYYLVNLNKSTIKLNVNDHCITLSCRYRPTSFKIIITIYQFVLKAEKIGFIPANIQYYMYSLI